jgi:TonB family protein
MKNLKRSFKVFIAIASLIPLLGAVAHAGNVKIIANPSVKADSISAVELRSVFLEESSSLSDGSHVEPVVSRGGATHSSFVKDYLGKTESDLQTYYRSLVFTGKGAMPKTIASDTEIAAYVAKTRGTIGYVSVDTNVEGVKTLYILGKENDGSRKLVTRVDPVYPATLQANHIGGIVRLEIVIAANGDVESVQVLGGNPILGESASIAVRKWVYAPGTKTKTEVSIPFDPNR